MEVKTWYDADNVFMGSISFTDWSTSVRWRFEAPQKALRFIEAWDNGILPKSFQLIVTESMLIGWKNVITRPYTGVDVSSPTIEPRGPRMRPVPITA